jgi:hypothetical protein
MAKDGGASASTGMPASIGVAAPLGSAATLEAMGAAEGPSESVYGVYGFPPWQLSHPPDTRGSSAPSRTKRG